MLYHNNLVRLLYFMTFALEVMVAIVLWRRGLRKVVPWFFTYVVYQAACILFFIYPLYELDKAHLNYYNAAWTSEAGAMVLSSVFIIEAFSKVLQSYEAIRSFGRNLLIITGLTLVVFTALSVKSGSEHSILLITKVTLVAERSVRCLQVGIIVVFLAFSSYLALNWKHYLFGIVFPYGLYAAVNLVTATYAAEMGGSVALQTLFIDAFAYIGLYLLWLRYLLKPEPRGPNELPTSAKEDLERWNEALEEMALGIK